MIQLPHGCRCSEPKVNPANWESPKASIRKNWYIQYRFYDPVQTIKYPKGKLRIIKGMNVCMLKSDLTINGFREINEAISFNEDILNITVTDIIKNVQIIDLMNGSL
jgi:hypothetical protein